MKIENWIKPVFIIAGLYDAILGILFLMIPNKIFEIFQITPPNHIGYVQFPALLLITFGIMFFQIAKDPITYRHLILYGILLKISYCIVVFTHWLMNNIPFLWVPFAFIDLLFLMLFLMIYSFLKQVKSNTT